MLEKIFSEPISVNSHAKITTYLDVVEPRAMGYWEIQSVVLPLQLHDVLTIRVERDAGIRVTCNDPRVATDETNTCYRAARLILERAAPFEGGLAIDIDKRIPVSSGLGGGSSNAAAVLLTLNGVLNLRMDVSEVARKAHSISRDSYFFCHARPAYVEKHADALTPLPQYQGALTCALVDAGIPFIRDKAGFVMGRVSSGARKKDVLPGFVSAWLGADAAAIRNCGYNFMTESLVPEYRKAFDIKRAASAELGLELNFTGTGPFLAAVFDGPVNQGLKELCNSMGATVSCCRVLT
jgi:4-diphosphocytidyl-2-C-methyl-D-erythritol kinase